MNALIQLRSCVAASTAKGRNKWHCAGGVRLKHDENDLKEVAATRFRNIRRSNTDNARRQAHRLLDMKSEAHCRSSRMQQE